MSTSYSNCEDLSPLTLATVLISLLATLFITYLKGKKQFCGRKEESEQLECKLTMRQRNRLKKIHMNLETLLKQQGLEVASLS
jgi:hypothetical protein